MGYKILISGGKASFTQQQPIKYAILTGSLIAALRRKYRFSHHVVFTSLPGDYKREQLHILAEQI